MYLTEYLPAHEWPTHNFCFLLAQGVKSMSDFFCTVAETQQLIPTAKWSKMQWLRDKLIHMHFDCADPKIIFDVVRSVRNYAVI